MPLIALTGGIATGKSRVARGLVDLTGALTIDTDRCARDLLERDAKVIAEIKATFGTGVAAEDGSLSRAALREIVFADAERRRSLEAILHPRIREAWTHWAEENASSGAILLVEIPLLYETDAQGLFDFSVAVGCSRAVQRLRLVSDRKLTATAADQIIASQWPTEEKIRRCDCAIWNDGSRAALETQIASCAHRLITQFSRLS